MRRLLILLALALLCLPAQGEVPLTGTFTASKACPALQSMRRGTNPGDVRTEPGTRYELLAGNTARPTHFRIVIPGADPERRWVEIGCGTRSETFGRWPTPIARQPRPAPRQYVLAVNWQPAFCETAPRKSECRNQRSGDFSARAFSLHGLWPQPIGNTYCEVSDADRWAAEDGRWRDLPRLDLARDTARDLERVMPGTRSGLDRYEWIKHGTCYGTDADAYYRDALALMEDLNASGVAALFANSAGGELSAHQIRSAFDRSFGPGAGERVEIGCEADGRRTIITELTIALAGDMAQPADLTSWLKAAQPGQRGCRGGIVDPVGLQ